MEKSLREKLIHTCTWCNQVIPYGEEVYGFGAKANPDINLEGKGGDLVSLTLVIPKKTVIALVSTENSEARNAGYDLVFVTCSQECAEELKEALQLEKDVLREES